MFAFADRLRLSLAKGKPVVGTLLAISLLATIAISPVEAARKSRTGSGSTSSAMVLNYEYRASSTYGQWYPHTCLTEDDYWVRSWVGDLDGTFVATLEFCGDPLTPGGEGFHTVVSGNGTLDIAITYPDGSVRHGLDMCVVPVAIGSTTIMPGLYTITLNAINGRNLAFTVDDGMATSSWEARCPASDRSSNYSG